MRTPPYCSVYLCVRDEIWIGYVWPVDAGLTLSFRRRWTDAADDAGSTTKPSARTTTSQSDTRITSQTAATKTIRRPPLALDGGLAVAAGTDGGGVDLALPARARTDHVIPDSDSRRCDVRNGRSVDYLSSGCLNTVTESERRLANRWRTSVQVPAVTEEDSTCRARLKSAAQWLSASVVSACSLLLLLLRHWLLLMARGDTGVAVRITYHRLQ